MQPARNRLLYQLPTLALSTEPRDRLPRPHITSKTFGMSRSWVKRYVGAARRGDPLAPKRPTGAVTLEQVADDDLADEASRAEEHDVACAVGRVRSTAWSKVGVPASRRPQGE